MADHVNSQIDTPRLRSHSDSSSPQRGVEIEGENGNECEKFQDTVPFDDDTMAIDSPLSETKTEKLDFETQVLDDSECFDEVVLDSEDEGNCNTQFARSANENGVTRDHVFNLQKKEAASNDKRCGEIEKNHEYGVNDERSEERNAHPPPIARHHETVMLHYIGSQELQDLSQANALEFVDQFLSFNKVDFSPEMDIKKTAGEKSPSVSSTKGPQSLAKKIYSRRTVRKTGIFEWVESNESGRDDAFSKGMGTSSHFQGSVQKSLMSPSRARDCDSEESPISCRSDTSLMEHIPKETCRIEKVSKLDEDLPGECERDIPETLDVGFDTQIAAEAMEALSNGLCGNSYHCDAYRDLFNTSENPPQDVIMKKNVDCVFLPKNDCINSSCVVKKSKQRKRTARKYVKDIEKVELDTELEMMTRVKRSKSLGRKCFSFNHSADDKENPGRSHSELIMRKNDGTGVKNTNKCKDFTSSNLVKHTKHTSSTIAGIRRKSVAKDNFRRTSGQPWPPAERMEDGIPGHRRKRSRLAPNPTKELKSKSHANSSAGVRESKWSLKEQSCQEFIAIAGLPRWNQLRRKRASRKGRTILKPYKLCIPLAKDNSEEGYNEGNTRNKKQKDNGETCIDTKGKEHRDHICSSLHASEKDLTENIDEPGSTIVSSNSNSASNIKGIIPVDPDQLKALTQSSKVDDMNSLLLSNSTKSNIEFEVSSNKNLKRCIAEMCINCTQGIKVAPSSDMSSAYVKRSVNIKLTNPPLSKELTRLGFSESFPDFRSRDSRRQRDTSQVRVLLSQHLEDGIIKQQKKIAAKLGISMASSIMDATHFIADSFSRTRNMLEAIALGKPVVTHLWLESCGHASSLIDEKNYIMRDSKKEKQIGFSLPVSVARANQHPLLKGLRVFITPNTKPNEEIITSLVKGVRGQVVTRSQISAKRDHKIQDDLLILSCEEDHAICVPFLDNGLAAYSSELLLNGIVIQKLEFERHRLFKNDANKSVKNSRSRSLLRA